MALKALGEPEKYFSLSRKELVEVHKVAYKEPEINQEDSETKKCDGNPIAFV